MRSIFLSMLLCLSFSSWAAKDNTRNFIPMIGDTAPEFTAESTHGIINFPADFGNNWKIIFSHPRDFTPVCSTELLELANAQSEFAKLGARNDSPPKSRHAGKHESAWIDIL